MHMQLSPVQFPLLLFKDILTLQKLICIFFSNACRAFFFFPNVIHYRSFYSVKSSFCLSLTTHATGPFPPGIPLDIWDFATSGNQDQEPWKPQKTPESQEILRRESLTQPLHRLQGNKHQLQNKEFYCYAVSEKKDTFEYEAQNTTSSMVNGEELPTQVQQILSPNVTKLPNETDADTQTPSPAGIDASWNTCQNRRNSTSACIVHLLRGNYFSSQICPFNIFQSGKSTLRICK